MKGGEWRAPFEHGRLEGADSHEHERSTERQKSNCPIATRGRKAKPNRTSRSKRHHQNRIFSIGVLSESRSMTMLLVRLENYKARYQHQMIAK